MLRRSTKKESGENGFAFARYMVSVPSLDEEREASKRACPH